MKHAQLLIVSILAGAGLMLFGYAMYVEALAGTGSDTSSLVNHQPENGEDSVGNVSKAGYDLTPYSAKRVAVLLAMVSAIQKLLSLLMSIRQPQAVASVKEWVRSVIGLIDSLRQLR